ncbi:hypothetical protein ASG29_13040 [Sphingomonas sp. Leaf412]|uniref:DUF6975 family protein n=1 Tax=Sphingomonas sp. Leaf412 TaxID=1736370 RepID=UPI0006FEC9DA|nr:hypothetical protein [Sphingomonas sp. Leaf412]KQT33004.1 hypothetical protein ASG29_13040 [Sphingomonas sp. Leaf412]
MEAATITVARSAPAMHALVAADGTAASQHARALLDPAAPLRDVADAVHALCILHGAFPGLVEHARDACDAADHRAWLDHAVDAMAIERALLARLAAAIGPQPSTPGQAASEAAIIGQRHALDMLARSDRRGCALGTALAFVLDWSAVRRVIDNGAARTGLPATTRFAATIAATHAFLDDLAPALPVQRAMTFGAQQTLAQHRGLWHLLEARASARSTR